MTPLPHKVQHVLAESPLLIVGAWVLLGFQYRAAFDPGFERLLHGAQYLNLDAPGLMLAAVALLIAPAAYHRLVERGEDMDGLHRVTTRVLEVALLPFALQTSPTLPGSGPVLVMKVGEPIIIEGLRIYRSAHQYHHEMTQRFQPWRAITGRPWPHSDVSAQENLTTPEEGMCGFNP
jgi:hypothetical protein